MSCATAYFCTKLSRSNDPFQHEFTLLSRRRPYFHCQTPSKTLSYSSAISNKHLHPLSHPVSWGWTKCDGKLSRADAVNAA